MDGSYIETPWANTLEYRTDILPNSRPSAPSLHTALTIGEIRCNQCSAGFISLSRVATTDQIHPLFHVMPTPLLSSVRPAGQLLDYLMCLGVVMQINPAPERPLRVWLVNNGQATSMARVIKAPGTEAGAWRGKGLELDLTESVGRKGGGS